jgi:hypothetical protein
VSLDERLLRLALHCSEQELQARRHGKPPGVQPWNAELLRALELELAVSLSRPRQDEGDTVSRFSHDDEWIDTRRAAAILGWTPRQVQRRTADLEGRKPGGHALVFRESVVREYAGSLTDARDTA